MEYKGYKIESIKNDGHLQRVAFGIYKNGKLISTATTSKEAQHEVDNIMNRPVTIEYIIVNKKNDSKSRETINTTESDVDKKIKELERKYSNDKTYYLRDMRKVRDMKTIDKLNNAIKMIDEDKWITVNGSHIKVDENGKAIEGNPNVVSIVNKNFNKSDNDKIKTAMKEYAEKNDKMLNEYLESVEKLTSSRKDIDSKEKEKIINRFKGEIKKRQENYKNVEEAVSLITKLKNDKDFSSKIKSSKEKYGSKITELGVIAPYLKKIRQMSSNNISRFDFRDAWEIAYKNNLI